MTPRQGRPSTEAWQQVELLCTWPEQRSYEVIRPVVLFRESAESRAVATGEPISTLYRHIQRFVSDGFAGLTAAAHPPPPHTLPPPVRQLIRDLKAEYSPLNTNEIARICATLLEYRPGARTIQRVLSEAPLDPPARRRYPPFHAMSPITRRRAVIQLHLEGWNKKSIAGYLATSRQSVHAIVQRWQQEDVAALVPKSHAPKRRIRKVTLRTIMMVRRLQRNPLLGAFRMHAALKQAGITVSPRTCGRILAVNRALLKQARPGAQPTPPQPMPFAATGRHEVWSIDIRYVDMHQLGGGMIYCFTVLDKYSRAVLASALTRSQNLTAYLFVLFSAIRNHGAPQAIVTDGGSVFRAKQAREVYAALGIRKDQIDAGQPWENYIETMFNVQRRMADYHFAQARSWSDLLDAHACWVIDYNVQDHWAHRERADDRRSPLRVLDWVHGRVFAEADLRRVFYTTRFRRQVDRSGYLRFRHWRIYAEAGLPGAGVAVWLYEEQVLVVYDDQALAQYTVDYQPDQRQIRDVTAPHLFDTHYRSPQLRLWELTDDEWRKAYPLPRPTIRRKPDHPIMIIQAVFGWDETA
jgi:transposase InsO family protein